jgi:hypothetical protein
MEWSGVCLNLPGQPGASVVSVRFAAEQRWLIACGETAGHRYHGTKKLLSSDVDFPHGRIDVAAPQLHNPDRCIPRALALGYLPQLLRSQSHRPPDLPRINGCPPRQSRSAAQFDNFCLSISYTPNVRTVTDLCL